MYTIEDLYISWLVSDKLVASGRSWKKVKFRGISMENLAGNFQANFAEK